MSSSRAMSSAQQRRVTMQKPVVPMNNGNPRKSIASRGQFQNQSRNTRQPQRISTQMQQPPPQMQMQQMQYNPQEFQQPVVERSSKRIHVSQALSNLSLRVTNLENGLYGDDVETDENDNPVVRLKEESDIDSSVLNAIVERIEILETTFAKISQLEELISNNTKMIELLNHSVDVSEVELEQEQEQEVEVEVETPSNNLTFSVEEYAQSEEC